MASQNSWTTKKAGKRSGLNSFNSRLVQVLAAEEPEGKDRLLHLEGIDTMLERDLRMYFGSVHGVASSAAPTGMNRRLLEHMHGFKHVFTSMCIYIYVCVYMCVCMYTGAFTYVYIYIYIYLCVRACVWECVCTSIYIYIQKECIYVCAAHTYIYIYSVCIYIYLYLYLSTELCVISHSCA